MCPLLMIMRSPIFASAIGKTNQYSYIYMQGAKVRALVNPSAKSLLLYS